MNQLFGSPIAVAFLIICSVLLLTLLKAAGGPGGPPAPVAKRFLTDRELAMLAVIERILPAHRIHAQVAMGALLQVPRQHGRKVSPADRNSFSQKIVDFVVQDRATGAIVALVEIDDYSHNAVTDGKRDSMTSRAGYTTIRIAGKTRPTLTHVREALAPLLALAERSRDGHDLPPRPSNRGGDHGAR
jgi:very-short-patch-repair endonuclease